LHNKSIKKINHYSILIFRYLFAIYAIKFKELEIIEITKMQKNDIILNSKNHGQVFKLILYQSW